MLREWRLEQVLGVGGFGIVYRGKGVYFDELVAIKEYFPSAISDRQDGSTVTPTDSSAEETYDLGLQKFVEEAKVLWNLSKPERHPNIVSVRSLFEIHGTAYMVMDFETGVSLSQALRDGRRFDEAGLLALIKPIAEGLDRAHGAGVLHRDIKPANILVDDTGRPVLIDFGSARFDSGQATSTKVTFYTPPYAALEQYVKTYPQGPWTDIYALGVTLYQCVTGEKPPEVLERLHGGLGETLSSRTWPGFSRPFTRAVDAAMAIRPADRPQSIPEWLKLFDAPDYDDDDNDDATRIAVIPSVPPAAPPVISDRPPGQQDAAAVAEPQPEAARRRPPLVAIGAAAAVALAIGAGVLIMRPGHSDVAKPSAVATSAPTAGAVPAAASPQPTLPALQPAFDGLIGDAQHAGRPASEIAALTAAKSKIAALTAQAQALAPTPGASAKIAPLISAMNSQAVDAAHAEATALAGASAAQRRDVEHMLKTAATDGSGAMSTVRQSKVALESTIAAVSKASDGVGSINAARQALAAYRAFVDADAAAARLIIPAKRAEIAAVDTSADAISNQVVTLASGSKPWLFSSAGRKQAYQQLQTNATSAKAQVAQLDQISRSASSINDLKQLDAALAQASAIKRNLNDLYSASYAASHVQ